MKFSVKRFGDKEKSSTFAIPFGKRVYERGGETIKDGVEKERSLTRLEASKYKQVPRKKRRQY